MSNVTGSRVTRLTGLRYLCSSYGTTALELAALAKETVHLGADPR